MLITIASIQLVGEPWHGLGAPKLRGYLTSPFIASDTTPMIAGDPVAISQIFIEYQTTLDNNNLITIPDVTVMATEDALLNVNTARWKFYLYGMDYNQNPVFVPFSLGGLGVRIPSTNPTTWAAIATYNAGDILSGVTIGGDVDIAGTVTAGHFVGDGSLLTNIPIPSSGVNSFNTRVGDVFFQSSDLNGLNGAGLTGIGSGTGGVINTGSTTIGADSDADDVGVLALQTQGVTREQINPDGSIQLFVDQFDIQRRTRNPIAAPGATLLADGTGNGTVGAHLFKYSYVTSLGETMLSPASGSLIFDASHTKATITVPLDRTQYEHNMDIVSANIYATKSGGSTYFKIATITYVDGGGPGSTSMTYTFNSADGTFSATTQPTSNTALNSNFFMDHYGSIGIGTTNLSTTDDDQGRNLTIESQTNYSYVNIGANTSDPNARVGGINLYNRGNGGNDHRVAGLFAFNDGVLGEGRLELFTGQNVVGPQRVASADHLGQWSIGQALPSANTRLYLESLVTSPVGATNLLIGADTNGLRFIINDQGYLGLGGNSDPAAPLSIGANNKFLIQTDGRIVKYADAGAKGDILVFNGTTVGFELLHVGADGTKLTADHTSDVGMSWL